MDVVLEVWCSGVFSFYLDSICLTFYPSLFAGLNYSIKAVSGTSVDPVVSKKQNGEESSQCSLPYFFYALLSSNNVSKFVRLWEEFMQFNPTGLF